ncbi:MAG: LamG-like jellyroll fold domain-containing protein [Elusimicrobiota bacterium]
MNKIMRMSGLLFGALLAMSLAKSAGAQTPGLVAHWDFDDGSGAIATDSSGNGNDCAVHGAQWTSGVVDGALSFDGADDHVDCGNPASLQVTGDMTIAFWARPAHIGAGRQNPICKAYGGEFCVTMEPNTTLSYYQGSCGGMCSPYSYLQTFGVFADETWVYVTLTRNVADRRMRLYMNGAHVNTNQWPSATDPVASDLSLKIAAGYVQHFGGLIDEVRIYDGELGAEEIAARFDADWAAYLATHVIIETSRLDFGLVSQPYSFELQAIGGSGDYTWEFADGSLPAGVSLSPDGIISGTPTESGSFGFTARATDTGGMFETRSLVLAVQTADGVVAYWPFDDGAGSVAADQGGLGLDGAVHGGAWVDGIKGKALEFDGLDDYVDFGNPASLQIVSDMTVEFWAKPADLAWGRQNPICKAYGGEFCITMEPSSQLSYFHGSCGGMCGGYMSFPTPAVFADDTWVHVAITRDVLNGRMELYMNGAYANATGWSPGLNPAPSDDPLRVGLGYTRPFKGLIDEVRLYDRVLNAEEIREHYTSVLTPTIDDLVGRVESLGLPEGIETSLLAKLRGARDALERGSDKAAVNKLEAFANEVRAQSGKKLTPEQADELTEAARKVIDPAY